MSRRLRVWTEKPSAHRAKWSVVYERPGGGRGRRTVGDVAEASRIKERIRSSLAEGRDPFPREEPGSEPESALEPPLEAMAHAWLDDLERARKRSTVDRHRNSLLLLLQFLEERTGRAEERLRGSDLTTSALREYRDWLARPRTGRLNRAMGRKPATIKKAFETVRLFSSWASRDERFREFIKEPASIPLPPNDETRTEAPTWEEMQKAIAAAREEYMRRAMVVMYYTGLRVDLQVMALRWSDVDLEAKQLNIKRAELCKSVYERKIARSVPIAPGLLEELQRWRQEATDSDAAFVISLERSRKSERRLRGRDTKRAWVRALGRWPQEWKNPNHCFRGGYITGLRRFGVDLEIVSYLVGQKSPFMAASAYTDLEIVHGEAAREAVGLIPGLG